MINIFGGAYIETMNLKNILENAGILVFVQNENMGIIEPWVVSAGGVNPVTLKVREEDYEKARKIIDDFQNGNLDIKIDEPKKE